MKEQEKLYKPWQYFFWMLSGSEISILKQCPTDYNRHAGIGFTILMTSVFGAFAGGYAGYYFTKSTWGAVGFGLLWGLLIFSIDRTMVVSLKKKPDTKWHSHFWQILFRAILAALIAFIISIPLELLIFRDNIDAGQAFYKQSQQLKLKSGQDSLYDPQGDAAKRATEEQKMERADSISRLDPPDSDFRNLINDLNTLRQKSSTLNADLGTARRNSSKYYNASLYEHEGRYIPDRSSASYKNYQASKTNEREIKQQIAAVNKEVGSLAGQIQLRRADWRLKYETERDSVKEVANMVAAEIAKEKKAMDSASQQFDETLTKIEQSFVVRFDVLTFLANKRTPAGEREFASIFFLLWLVRILFFVIEILPTIVKVATPFGAYDMAIYEEEENFKNIKLPAAKKLLQEKVEQEHSLQAQEKERRLALRLKKEGELHDSLVEEISKAQDKIAKKILEDWKQKHLSSEKEKHLYNGAGVS